MNLFRKLAARFGLDRLISGETFRNISTLMSGTFISAVIPMITAPIMSRLFTTSDYGVLGLYMSISGLIGVLAYSHYSQAIMLAKDNEEAKQVLWFSIVFCGGVSMLTLAVMSMLSVFSSIIDDSVVGHWLYLIPASIFLNGINASVLLWANRTKQYTTLASNKVIQAVLTVIVQIVFGLAIKNETGLLLGLIFGQTVSVILLLSRFGRDFEHGIGKPQLNRFKTIAKHYRNLLIFSTPSEFINNLINQTPVFLLQKFGGVSFVGSYNFTTRFLGLPQQFLSSAIVDVFKQKASHAYNTIGNCRDIFIKTMKVLGILGIVPFGFLILFAPQLFALVFGEQWREAGIFAQFLSIMYFFRFVVSPLSYVYVVAKKFREDFILHLFFLFITTIAFYVSNLLFENKRMMILFYSIGYSLAYLLTLMRSYSFSKGDMKS